MSGLLLLAHANKRRRRPFHHDDDDLQQKSLSPRLFLPPNLSKTNIIYIIVLCGMSTPAKRKVAITFEDDDDSDDDDEIINGNGEGISSTTDNRRRNEAADDHKGNNNNTTTSSTAAAVGVGARPQNNDPSMAKTPIGAAAESTDDRTPGSSGGMIMRSGKKKKKRPRTIGGGGATSETTANGHGASRSSIHRARKRSKLTGNEDNSDDEIGHVGEKSGYTCNEHGTIGGKEGAEIRDDDMVGLPLVVNGNNGRAPLLPEAMAKAPIAATTVTATATAQKVPPAMTREAIAAAQVTESTVEEEEGNDDEKIENEVEEEDPAAVAVNTTVGGGILRLLSQRLRLPSQHTPKNPIRQNIVEGSVMSSVQSGVLAPPLLPPPPGGRRLIFDTASKTHTTTTTTSTHAATATAGGGKNKFLAQTRQQQHTAARQLLSTTTIASSIGGSAPQQDGEEHVTTTASSSTKINSLHNQILQEWQQNKHQLILYTQQWFVLLLICFVSAEVFLISTMWNAHNSNSTTPYSSSSSNSGGLTTTWREWHGIISPMENDPARGDDSKHIIVTDPILLANARATMRAERMNLHDVQKLEQNMVEMQESLKLLEDATHRWTVAHPYLLDLFVEEDSSDTKRNASEVLLANDLIASISSTIDAKQKYLLDWELALVDAERAWDAYDKSEIPPSEVNDAMLALSHVSMMKFHNAMILDLEEKMLVLPGEGCGGMDYIPLKQEVVVRINEDFEGDVMDEQKNEDAYKTEEHENEEENEENMEDQDLHEEDQYDEEYDEAEEYDGVQEYDEAQGSDVYQDYSEESQYVEKQVHTEELEENEFTGNEGGDVFDSSSNSPVRFKEAQTAYESLIQLAESTSQAVFNDSTLFPSKWWAQQIIQEELSKRGVDAEPPSMEKLLHEPILITLKSSGKNKKASSSSPSYTTHEAVRDIAHRLEIEDADRTGKFDYASAVHGARVLRRGPFATSYSYYESLPLLNRLLAYTKLRFYGHPPEVALYPTFPMYARGQCWSFSNEATSLRSRRQNIVGGSGSNAIANDMVGEYATLTVSLVSAIRVTEIVMEHPPSSIFNKGPPSSSSSAVQDFRVLGFEDGGAFGEPWELGRYTFDVRGLSLQTFAIPTALIGQNIPKLKAISIAIDSNWGAEYGCLYRVRVLGD